MGLNLDWEIEAEQTNMNAGGEDPVSARARRLARLRVLLGVLLVLGMFGGLYGALMWRLNVVDAEIEQALRDTIDAEVTALRVADRSAYLSVQRSADEAWLQEQRDLYDLYQRLKTGANTQLTGEVVALMVDGTRGRAQVQEIIDGVPYVRTWFYWRYADGWRHVPPDYTFWGEQQTIEQDGLIVQYQELDETVAEVVASEVARWLSIACEALECDLLPDITVQIAPDVGDVSVWDANNPWTLRVPSPYVERTRQDRPFDGQLKARTAALMAARLVDQALGDTTPAYPADAVFMADAVSDWLLGEFTGLDAGSYLMNSYAERYGRGAVGDVMLSMGDGSDIRLLTVPASVSSINELAVDWRDYLSWRLNTENELHQRRDLDNYVAMYDVAQPEISTLAFARYNEAIAYEPYTVVAVQPEVQPDGSPGLVATVDIGDLGSARRVEVLFRLSDGQWKRAE
ncbi:MAG: hypothetical protein AAF125_19125 [Chloroflexota bacterium]